MSVCTHRNVWSDVWRTPFTDDFSFDLSTVSRSIRPPVSPYQKGARVEPMSAVNVRSRDYVRSMSDSIFRSARPYPVNLRLHGKPVLCVGAGAVAVRKVEQLLEAGADVTAIGPEVNDQLERLAASPLPGTLWIEQRRYQRDDVAGYSLVITCTDDAEVNRQVHDDGVAAGVWVNSADDPENCEFTLASVVRSGDLQIAISTEGRSPALAMYLRRRFENEFDQSWAQLLDLLSNIRDEAALYLGTSEVTGWQEALDSGLIDLVAAGELDVAADRLRSFLGLPVPSQGVAS